MYTSPPMPEIDISINQYKFYSERNITKSIKIFLQLYMIKTDLLT